MQLAGLGLDQLNSWSSAAILHNLKYGRPSQAAGVSHLQFMYRIHDTLPANKKMSMNVNLKAVAKPENTNELIKQAQELSSNLQALISEFKK